MNKRTPPLRKSSSERASKFTPTLRVPLRRGTSRNKSDSRTGEYRKRAPAARSNGYDERKVSSDKRSSQVRAAYPKPTAKGSELKAVRDTSWGPVAEWYDKHLEKSGDTYHEKVVHPNLLRMLGDIKNKQILDLACGQGVFSRILADHGANIIGVDLGKELIDIAEKKNEKYAFKIHYFHSTSDDLYMIKDASKDIVVCVLALQNIQKLQETVNEVSRVLKNGGKFFIVLNHPSFRNPQHTHWGYDENEKVQFRRVEEYLSESKVKIDMTPGSRDEKKFTVSFHRPLQVYVKAFSKYGFAVTRLEEWVSHKASQSGPRKASEDKARKEIPLFLALEARKTIFNS